METSTRQMTFLLAGVERHALVAIARRIPRRLVPDHLTGVGVVGALGAGLGYALSFLDPLWLWLASAMLVVNWVGDSLDGTLARVRKTERPKYGYYLDHVVDAFSTAVVGIGIGLSPFVEFELALVAVVVYLVLSINVYLESSVFGVFKMAYGVFGPTEARIMLILLNIIVLVAPVVSEGFNAALEWVVNGGVAGVVTVMCGILVVRVGKNLRKLSTLEPQTR